jgi:polyphenol oxidase
LVDVPEVLRAAALDGVAHGFLGRRGGVSRGLVSGLNVGLGADDDAADVAQNRARAVAAVAPGARLVTAYQVHSPDCVVAGPWDDAHRPHADALVTDQPGVVLGIVTADCAPILLADHEAGVVGAAHAGWKGAFGGVAEATVAAMVALGARRERIAAAIGPCIAQASYEVDEGFRARFLAQGDEHGRFFAAGRAGHWQFDLEAYVAHRLERAGLARITPLGRDTYTDEEGFFSFRRATHRAEATYGRQFSLIALT